MTNGLNPFRPKRKYEPPARPPIKTPVPTKEAKAEMDRDPSGERPSLVVVDESAAAVARLLGWDVVKSG